MPAMEGPSHTRARDYNRATVSSGWVIFRNARESTTIGLRGFVPSLCETNYLKAVKIRKDGSAKKNDWLMWDREGVLGPAAHVLTRVSPVLDTLIPGRGLRRSSACVLL